MSPPLRPSFWLTLRLLRSPRQRLSLAVVMSCCFLIGLVALGLCAIPTVIDRQRDVTAISEVRSTGRTTGVYAWRNVTSWRDQSVIFEMVVALEPGHTAVGSSVPPGVTGTPRVGDIWVSAPLRRLAEKDPALAAAYPRDRLRPIDSRVLENSRTLRAVRVVNLDDFRGASDSLGLDRPDAAFGAPPEFRTSDPVQVMLAVGALLVLVALPLWLLLTSAYAAVSVPRQQQETLLRQVGLGRRRARFLVAADATALGLVSAMAAVAAFPVLTRVVTTLPGLPGAWSAGQPGITPSGLLVALVAPLLASVNASRRARDRPRRNRTWFRAVRRSLASERSSDLLAVALLAAAVVAVLVNRDLRMDASLTSARTAVLLIAALALTAVLGQSGLTRLIAAAIRAPLIRTTGRAPSLWVACCRVARTRAPSGAAGAMAGIFVVAIAAVPLVAQVAPRDQATADLNRAAGRVLVSVSGDDLQELRDTINTDGTALAIWAPRKQRNGLVFRMDCDQARLVLVRRTCTPGPQVTAASPIPRALAPQLNNLLQARWQIEVPSGADWTPAGRDRRPADKIASTGRNRTPLLLVAVPDVEAYWRLVGHLRGAAPRADVYAENGGLIGGAAQSYFVMQKWLIAGLVLALALAGIMVLLGALDEVRRTLDSIARLHAAGLSRRSIRGVVTWAATLRAAGLGIVMAVTGVITAFSITHWSNVDPLTPRWTGILIGVGAAIVVVTILAPAAASGLDRTIVDE